MAEKMKRMMALTIVMSMLMGVLALPVRAEETGEADGTSETTVTVEITNGSGTVIGEKTTVTTTTTTDTTDSYHQETNTSSNWNTKDSVETDYPPVTEGNTTIKPNNKVVTEVTGSETTQDNVHTDKDSDVSTYSGSTSGSEKTTVTDTSTSVTTTTGVTLVDTIKGPVNTIDNQQHQGREGSLTTTEEGSWEHVGTDDNGYEMVSGSEQTRVKGTSDIDVDEDPLKNNDVSLNMEAPTDKESSSDSEKLHISMEDALENDIHIHDGRALGDGTEITYQYDADGNIIGYTVTKVTSDSSEEGEIIEGSPAAMVSGDDTVTTYIKPEGFEPGSEDIKDDSGAVIGTKTVEEILDDNGNVIGYTITEEVRSSSGAVETIQSLPTPEPSFFLPERPSAPEPVTENGLTTTVTVEDVLDENGNTIGFKTTTTVTDADGKEVSAQSETIYGTATTYSSTLVSTPTSDEMVTTTVTTVYGTLTTQTYSQSTPGVRTNVSTRDVSQQIYQLVETRNGLYFLFEGKMYQVEGISDSDYTHGETRMTSLQPNISGLEPKGNEGTINTTTDLRASLPFSVSGGPASGYELKYVDYGLESRIKVEHSTGSTLAHQFVLKDEHGNKHYVLCVDLNTSALKGASYNMDNVINSGYFDDLATAKKVEAIALNGYWGTTSGTGSLDHVKQVLRDAKAAGLISLSNEEINNITPGEALTATQAALWYYGDSSGKTRLDSDVTGDVYDDSSDKYSVRDPYTSESSTVNALYKALISLNTNTVTNNTTELLNETNFATETQLVIKEKATDSSGKVKTDASGNEKYLTDLTFTVDVKKSDLTGNLVVTITDEKGNALHDPIQLKTSDSNLVGKVLADGTAGTDYTIKDLELPAGVTFNLNLSGTQNLSQGAYLYTAEVYSTSQTFIGVATGTQEVNLNVKMEFNVTEPKAKVRHSEKTWTEEEKDTEYYTKVDQYQTETKGTLTNQTVTVKTTVKGTTVQTDVTESTTQMLREWRSNYLYQLTNTSGDDGGSSSEKEDKDAPRAKAPKTGDITGLLAAACLFSAGGLVVLNRKKDEE